ncbi:transposase [Candidatus Bathyarchaeota archaeon]|nr:transposase [Candidatus Bathyarchaeota archaeon]
MSDLEFVERILLECYRPEASVGRPHRSLLSMFKAELTKRLGGVELYRELYRLLQIDEVLRGLCEIKHWEKPYGRSTLAEFRQRVGPERFERIMAAFTCFAAAAELAFCNYILE